VPRVLLSPDEVEALTRQGSCVIVDCRASLSDLAWGARVHAEGHIPGAVHADLVPDLSGPVGDGRRGRHPLPEPQELARRLGAWGIHRDTEVVAYDDAAGAFAARVWWLLRWLGHDAVALLDGGVQAWTDSGRALTRETPAPRPALFEPRVRPELAVDADVVERIRARGDRRLIDARAAERFRGEVEPIDRVAGHIPGARSLPLSDNLAGGRFRSREEIRARFERELEGIRPEHAVAYCGSGVTACHLILAAEYAGLHGIRLYPGSWSEWISGSDYAKNRRPSSGR
jgi:thiosulfate/3-mercaptopyruvate sulfurtransferase